MTSPIQGSARVRVIADTSRVVPDVLAAFQAAVAAAQEAIAEGLTLTADPTPLQDAVADATAAVTGLADEAVDVTLDADAGPLQAEVGQAAGAFDQLVSAASTAASGIRSALSGAFDGLAAAASAVGSTVSAGLQAGATAAAALGAATISAGIGFNALSQSAHQGLTAVLGTRDAARDLIAEVIELNATAAFSRQAFIGSTQVLVGFGVEADQVTGVLDAMQQAVVAVGGGEAEFAQLSDILARVASQGEVTGETLQRLGEMGINLAQVIADTTGDSVEAVEDAIAAGEIGLDEITEALNTRYAGAVEGYADTWAGAQGMVQAAIRNIGSALVEAFIGLEEGGAGVEGLNAIADGLFHVQSVVLPALLPQVEQLAELFVSAATAVGGFLESIPEDAVSDAFSRIASTLEGLGPLVGALAAGFATLFSSSLASGIPIIGQLLGALNPIVVALGVLIAATPELRTAFVDAFTQIADAVAPLGTVLADVAGTLLDAVTPLIATLAGVLGEVVAALAPVVASIASGLMPLLGPLSDLLSQVAEVVGDALVTVLDAVGPVLGSLVESLSRILGAVLPLVGAFTPLVGVLAEVVAAAVGLLEALSPVWELLADLVETVMPPLVAVIELLATALSDVLSQSLENVSTIFEGLGELIEGGAEILRSRILPAFEDVAEFIVDEVVPALEELWQWWADNVLPIMTRVAEVIWDDLLPALQELGGNIREHLVERLQDAWEWFQENLLPTLRDDLLPALQDLARVLQERVGQAVEDLRELWEDDLQPAWERIVAVWHEDLQPALQDLWELVQADLLPALRDLWTLIDGPLLSALQFFAVIVGGAVYGSIIVTIQAITILTGAFSTMIQGVSNAVSWFTRWSDVLSGPLTLALAGVRAGMQGLIGTFATIVGWLQQVAEGANRVADALSSIPGIGLGGIGEVIFGATGAIIDHPTTLVAGEGGRREVLIPLEQGPARAWELALQSGLVDLLGNASAGSVWREKPMPAIVNALSQPIDLSPGGGGAGSRRRGSATDSDTDPELLAEIKKLNQHMARLGTSRPINVTQAPGEDGEALARRVVSRMTLAAGI